MALYLYNTLTRKKEEFKPMSPPLVKMYVCGMTVQDRPHIGHMRAYIVSDMLKKWLRYRGFRVKHIQNFTDIDDKIIERAKILSMDYREISEKNIDEFIRCSDIMGIERADFYPRATQHIQEIIEITSKLLEKGHAYTTEKGVYFDISSFPGYGKLSGKRIDDLVKGARVEVDRTKHSPLDFALWKGAKGKEPFWESPWGRGRPGWHIECSAMSITHLGETIDIHTGGEDLIFPHHENEIAQSENFTNKPFARFWVHNGLLQILGDKMSKSSGEFIPALEVLKRYDPNSVRLFLLAAHYRHPIEYDEERLKEENEALRRISECLFVLKEKIGNAENIKSDKGNIGNISLFFNDFESAMDDDLNTPMAIGRIYSLVKEINTNLSHLNRTASCAYRTALINSLNILGISIKDRKTGELTPHLMEIILEIRQKLRKDKKYDIADNIRKKLSNLGITLKDIGDGSVWKI